MKRKLIIILFIISLITLGFIREFIFVNINILIYNNKFNEHYPFHLLFKSISTFNYKELYTSKWFLTAIFIILFYLIQRKISYFIFEENIFKKWFFYLYLILIVLATITFFAGWLFNDVRQGYTFSRLFLGFLQSPLPIVFLTPVCYFYKKNISYF
jgi:hypothetical protein